MKEVDEVPEEIKCFICMKLTATSDCGLFCIRFKQFDPPKYIQVFLCNDDFAWAEGNQDAALALVKSRIMSLIEQENDSNS